MSTHTIKFFLYNLIAGFSALLIVACGGGGGGDGGGGGGAPTGDATPVAPTNPIAIDDTNSSSVADEAYDSIDIASDAGSIVTGIDSSQVKSKKTIVDLTKLLADIYKKNVTRPEIIAAATEACSNGGTQTFPDSTDGTGTYSFNNCNIGGGVVVNGSISFTGSGSADGTSFSGSIAYTSFSTTVGGNSFTIRGGYSLSWSTSGNVVSGSISGTIFQIEFNGETVDLVNFSVSYTENIATTEETLNFDYTVNSTLLNGSIGAVTETTLQFTMDQDFFYAGSAVCIGLNNTRVRVTAQGSGLPTGMVFVETDADGNDDYELSEMMTWAQLDASSPD